MGEVVGATMLSVVWWWLERGSYLAGKGEGAFGELLGENIYGVGQ